MKLDLKEVSDSNETTSVWSYNRTSKFKGTVHKFSAL